MGIIELLENLNLTENSQNLGGKIKICCPFHDEKHPSLCVNVYNGFFHCFGCSRNGSIYDIVSYVLNIPILEAIKKASSIKLDQSNRKDDLSKNEKQNMLEWAHSYYLMMPETDWFKINSNYLLDRGFNKYTLRQFGVKLLESTYPINIPLYEDRQFKGLCKRLDYEPDDKKLPKYKYNLGLDKTNILIGNLTDENPILVVEGILDLMTAYQFGYRNCCCLLGWKPSEYQINKLKKYNVPIICALDNDKVGKSGHEILKSQVENVYRFNFDKEKDLSDLTSKKFNKIITEINRRIKLEFTR